MPTDPAIQAGVLIEEVYTELRRIAEGYVRREQAKSVQATDLVHEAYLADARVRAFLLRENPAAAGAIADRLESAHRRGLWHPRRNDIDTDLRALRAEAR